MELHEKRCKRKTCHRFRNIPERISREIERFFYRLGVCVAQNPLKWMLGCFVIAVLCLFGLFCFRQEKNPAKLWIPPDSDFVFDTEWLMSHYEEAMRIEQFVLTGDNILEQQTLIKLNEITKKLISVQTPIENLSWTDVCMKIPSIARYNRIKRQSSTSKDNFFDDDLTSKINETSFEPSVHIDAELYCDIVKNLPKACFMFSILDIWKFDSAKIKEDSTEQIISKINTIKVSPTLGYPMNFSDLLGGITLDERGRIIAATAIKTEMFVHVNFVNVNMDKIGNIIGTADWVTVDVLKWESIFLETMKKFSNELLSKKNENDSLKLYYEAGRSYGDISGSFLLRDMDKLIVGVLLMFLYVSIILSNHSWVEWRFCLTITGLLCVGSSFIFAVGICSLLGIPYGPIHTCLPFLLLGLGVDDIFVMNASWKKIHTDELNLSKPLAERIGLALGHAGSAITVTSFTDIVAFIIGATTILPSLRSFCIYAVVGIFLTYLLQITFFVAYFTIDASRIEQKRNGMLPCIVHENFTPRVLNPSSALSWKFINALYTRVILTTPGKIIIVIVTLITMSTSIVGTLRLEQWFDPMWLLPRDSHLSQYVTITNQAFPDRGFEAFVLMGDVDYSSDFSKIISLTERLKNTSFIREIEVWPIKFAQFVSMYYGTDLKTTKIAEEDFLYYLSKFLFSRKGGIYQRNFLFNETLTCGKKAPSIVAATIDFNFKHFATPAEWVPAMDDSKYLVKVTSNINGYTTVWCKMFAPWIADKWIAQELSRNLTLALICVMSTTILLIAEVQTCFWILICILLTLLNVCGFMYFWGLTIDMISCIGLQLAVGLSVDYAAHVAHAFLNAESREDDNDARTTRALVAVRYIGAAVAYGAGSTLLAILMLAFSTFYVLTAFCRIFSLVILFGLWHGLIFLPVVLSTIGPRGIRTTRSKPMSEKTIAMIDDDD